ncbi:MAG: S-layer homology domain-containing protein [Oscillospiraceae bacterium]
MKKFLSLVLALVMTMSLVTVSAGAKDFADDSKITYKEAVDVMSAAKVIDGYTDGSFNPTATLTRGAAAKIICNLILGPTTASALVADAAPYSDVPTTHTFAGYIAYCQKEGIISGYADGTFRPANTLTGYAFMKMLLGALGYDAEVEQYTGANWSINVAKRALNIGLDDDLVGDFNGVKAVTREEACLYALNTLTADMVEYDAKTTVSTNGTTVVIAGSKAKEMVNNGNTDGKVFDKDGVMQFAEKYFDNLSVKTGSDEFERPANVWKLKAEEIGTYTNTPDATYTKKVEVGDIYKDLGLGSKIEKKDVSVYVDGVANASQAPVAITKGDDTNKYGDNGVLTEVFYDDDAETVTITEINTYIGSINKTVKATDKKDAYVVVTAEHRLSRLRAGLSTTSSRPTRSSRTTLMSCTPILCPRTRLSPLSG